MSSADGERLLNVRPPIHAEETIPSYVQRLACANHCDHASWIADMLGANPATIATDLAAIDRLAEVVGADPSRLRACGYALSDGLVYHRGHVFPKDALRLRNTRVCPSCLASTGIKRWWWDLAPIGACPDHECLFVDCCPGCQRPITTTPVSAVHCSCGFDFSKVEPVRADHELLRAASELVGLCRGETMGRLEGLPGDLGLGEALELLSVLVRVHLLAVENEKASGPTLKRLDIAALTARSATYLPNWPARSEDLLVTLDMPRRLPELFSAPMRPLYHVVR
jgi:hypothetical protein